MSFAGGWSWRHGLVFWDRYCLVVEMDGEGGEGGYIREKGGFAAVRVAKEEDGDGWGVIVHEQLPINGFTAWNLHFYKALIT